MQIEAINCLYLTQQKKAKYEKDFISASFS